jgi:uncharacterized membrane protein
VAIPLALDARWSSAAWAVEGAAIIWVGVRQDRKLARAFGILLQLGAAFFYLLALGNNELSGEPPLLNPAFVGAVLVAVGALASERLLSRVEWPPAWERVLAPLLFAWGLAWWLAAGLIEIQERIPGASARSVVHLTFFAGSAAAFAWMGQRRAWKAATIAARGAWLLVVFSLLEMAGTTSHPLKGFGWVAWPFTLAVLGAILRVTQGGDGAAWRALSHVAWVMIAAVVGAWELHWLAGEYTDVHTAWTAAGVIIPPALLLVAIGNRAADSRWPVDANVKTYRVGVPMVFAVCFALWFLVANTTRDGRSDPLPYLPLLNALDLAHILCGVTAWGAWLAARRSGLQPSPETRRRLAIVAGVFTFLWLNAVLLRTLHHWGDVPFNSYSMMHSVLVQASLSIFWSLLALGVMVFGTRRAARGPWILGAVLMGVVVVKLFIIDLSNVGGIARIVSFIAVGVLMLVIGYFSPVPPRAVEQAS